LEPRLRLLATLLCLPALALAQAPDAAKPAAPLPVKPQWAIATTTPHAGPGATVEVVVISLAGEPLPDEMDARLSRGAEEQAVTLAATGPAEGARRSYSFIMPRGASGSVALELVARSSSVLVLLVDEPPGSPPQEKGTLELPLSEADPMYFIVGGHGSGDLTAKFQLSFKYRMFDTNAGYGKDVPWLAGFYFAYTQTSIWDLTEESKPFRDTNYRPSLFWQWQRTDDRTWIDAFRAGLEHESNGRGGAESRSINTVFVRPEWHWKAGDGGRFEFTPKAYAYLDKSDNPDINHYRGYVDWRVRYDSGVNWVATGVLRYADTGHGSVQLDLSRRIRDLKFGPIGGYLHFQVFSGYGEELLDYNLKRDTQFRIGFSIVP
jgi:hypothetical protein